QTGEDGAQPVELAAGAEGKMARHQRRAATRSKRTNPLSVATQSIDRSTTTSRTAAGTSHGIVSTRAAPVRASTHASPVVPPTQRLSPTASRLSTATPRLPIAVASPSPPTTASPRDVPTHTPSGAGATLVTSSDGSPRPTSYSRLR